MTNVAIIIGHDEKKQGATSYAGISEYDYNRFIGDLMVLHHKYKKEHGLAKIEKFVVLNRNKGWSQVSRDLKENKIDISLELHFNAFNKKAYGTETLALVNDSKSQEFARAYSLKLSEFLGTKLRGEKGVKKIKSGQRGYYNLDLVKKSGVSIVALVEPCFANFQTSESERLMNNPIGYAQTIYNVLERWGS